MKVLLLLSLFASTVSFAQDKPKDGGTMMRLKPGLWKIDMRIIGPDGKEFNPMGMMAAAMDSLPPDKKKEIMEKMGGAGMGGGKDKGMKVCMTKEMVDEPGDFANHDKNNCESKILEKTSNKIKTEFKCKDGTTGVSLWRVKSPSAYAGVVKVKNSEMGQNTMKFEGAFEASDCGDVKPPNQMKPASEKNTKK